MNHSVYSSLELPLIDITQHTNRQLHINISNSRHNTEPSFFLAFAANTEPWVYYIIVTSYLFQAVFFTTRTGHLAL